MILVYLVHGWSQPRQGSVVHALCMLSAFKQGFTKAGGSRGPLPEPLFGQLSPKRISSCFARMQGCLRQQLFGGSGEGELDGAFLLSLESCLLGALGSFE